MKALDAKAVVALDYQSSVDAETSAGISECFGENLLGVIVNRVIRHREREVRQSLQATELPNPAVLGIVPEDRLMVSISLNQVAQALGGEWVWGQEQGANLVERYLIGGNLMDQGDTYFNRLDGKAVIVRGDRPDIQLSSLTGPMVGLINTGGHKPVEYVLHEVEQLDVPLMVTPHRTEAAVEALGAAIDGANAHHPQKIARFLQLLEQHCNIDATLQGLL